MKREINQLWFFAKYYFSLATKLNKKLPQKCLDKTPGYIAKKYLNLSDASRDAKRAILMTAHLSSCCVRLVTIDERIKENFGRSNRIFPNYLNKSKNSKTTKTIAQLRTILLHNKGKYIHQMLRDNVAHIERSRHRNKRKEDLFEARQRALESLTYREIYDCVDKVLQRFKEDLVVRNLI